MKLSSKGLILPSTSLSRRKMLFGGAAAAASLVVPAQAKASIVGRACFPGAGRANPGDVWEEAYSGNSDIDESGAREVHIVKATTGEVFKEVYCVDNQYIPEALEKYNYLARDTWDNTQKSMDPKLLDIIWKLTQRLEITTPWRLNSGYRSPAHNANIKGAAKNSQHLYGKANDIVSPQRPPSTVFKCAKDLKMGGCGIYQNFTHVDTGNVRTWSG